MKRGISVCPQMVRRAEVYPVIAAQPAASAEVHNSHWGESPGALKRAQWHMRPSRHWDRRRLGSFSTERSVTMISSGAIDRDSAGDLHVAGGGGVVVARLANHGRASRGRPGHAAPTSAHRCGQSRTPAGAPWCGCHWHDLKFALSRHA
ncbi:hypothetical protein GCM10017687_05450 [Streptomyces echinatus]